MTLQFVKSVVSPPKNNVMQAIEQHKECLQLVKDSYIFEAAHKYTDKDGNTEFYRVRFKQPYTKEKWIRPVYFNGNEWVWKEPEHHEGLKPLYNLQTIAANSTATIWVCEGEWAADQLNKFFKLHNIFGENVATTSGSATSAEAADWTPLKNHKIVIWPDNDDNGGKYSSKVAKILSEQYCQVEIVDVKSLKLPPSGDIVDWLAMNQQATADDFKQLALIPDVPKNEKSLIDFMLSAKNLMKLALAELEYIVFPFITIQSLIMVYAMRGIGKTWFSLQLAISVALGQPFFAWEVPKPRRVLFIDGEMPLKSLQQRLKYLCVDDFPELLNILPSEILWRNGQSLNLNDETDLDAIDEFLVELASTDQAPELIIIDNLSSMTAGTDENGNSEMDTMLRWLLKLRSQGYAVLLVHHAGKNGDQRGGSRREDFLDTSIKLKEASKSTAGSNEVGACFNIEFVKSRGLRPIPDSLKVELSQDEHGFAKWKTEGADILPAYYEALRLIRDCEPKSQKELASLMGISASAVSQQLKSARTKGLLENVVLKLTDKGKVEIDKHYKDFNLLL